MSKPNGKGTLAWALIDDTGEMLEVALMKEELSNTYILEKGDGYKFVRVRIVEVSDEKK